MRKVFFQSTTHESEQIIDIGVADCQPIACRVSAAWHAGETPRLSIGIAAGEASDQDMFDELEDQITINFPTILEGWINCMAVGETSAVVTSEDAKESCYDSMIATLNLYSVLLEHEKGRWKLGRDRAAKLKGPRK